MATKEQLTAWLNEALQARHRLMTGEQVVQARDSNGEMVTYSTANASRLDDYIKQLRAELAGLNGVQPLAGPLRPVWS